MTIATIHNAKRCLAKWLNRNDQQDKSAVTSNKQEQAMHGGRPRMEGGGRCTEVWIGTVAIDGSLKGIPGQLFSHGVRNSTAVL